MEKPAEIEFFKSSDLPVPEAVKTFLQEQTTKIAFNKYCIDCTKNRTSHFIVWTGTFVCRKCANQHLALCGHSLRNCYVKEIYKPPAEGSDKKTRVHSNEHWDDYQLKSMTVGGNKALYDLLNDYEMLELPL